jgi:hypothetical protein
MWVLVQIKDWFKHWFIALVFLIIVAVVWIVVFVAMSPFFMPVFIASKWKSEAVFLGVKMMFKSWSRNMFIVQDAAANTVLGGSRKKHVSGRVGYHSMRENGIAMKMEVVIDLIFKVLKNQDRHCRASIESGESYNVNWGG